jgi:hypothetical protein
VGLGSHIPLDHRLRLSDADGNRAAEGARNRQYTVELRTRILRE